MELNNWDKTPVIKRQSILNFEFLSTHGHLQEIEDGYYFLLHDLGTVELDFYMSKSLELAGKLGIKNLDVEIKEIIKKINIYNELRDIGNTFLGKLAEIRNTTIKCVHEEFSAPEK